jgi:hypothetical protein
VSLNSENPAQGPEKEHVYVFFCQMPKTKARSGAFQKGAYLPAIWQAGVRSNPDFIGTVNV